MAQEEDTYSQGFDDDQLNISIDSSSNDSRSRSTSEKSGTICRESSVNNEGRCVGGTSRFRALGNKIRAAQTASKSFQSSQDVRDAVYEEWLERKSVILRTTQRQLHEEKMKKDATLKMKAVRIDTISTDCVLLIIS